MNQVTGSAASPTKSVFDAFGAIGCGIYVGGAVAVTLYFLQEGGIRLTEGLPVAAVVAAAVAALLTLVRCVLTGFYVPLAMIGVFVLGFGAITKISANLPDPVAVMSAPAPIGSPSRSNGSFMVPPIECQGPPRAVQADS